MNRQSALSNCTSPPSRPSAKLHLPANCHDNVTLLPYQALRHQRIHIVVIKEFYVHFDDIFLVCEMGNNTPPHQPRKYMEYVCLFITNIEKIYGLAFPTNVDCIGFILNNTSHFHQIPIFINKYSGFPLTLQIEIYSKFKGHRTGNYAIVSHVLSSGIVVLQSASFRFSHIVKD